MDQTLPRPVRIHVRRGSILTSQKTGLYTVQPALELAARAAAPNLDLANLGWILVAARGGARVYRRSSALAELRPGSIGGEMAA